MPLDNEQFWAAKRALDEFSPSLFPPTPRRAVEWMAAETMLIQLPTANDDTLVQPTLVSIFSLMADAQ